MGDWTHASDILLAGAATAAHGSRPAAGVAGRLFLPSDGYSAQRDTGAAWVPWGPLFPFTTPPSSGGFTWVNQGGATATDAKDAVYLLGPATAGTNLRLLVKAKTAPYVITAAILPVLFRAAAAATVGLFFRQSSDGKLSGIVLYWDTGNNHTQIGIFKWTNATTFSASYFAERCPMPAPLFFRIADNSTNRIYSISRDGQNFHDLHTVTRTDFHTADQVGYGVDAGTASSAVSMQLLSWVEA